MFDRLRRLTAILTAATVASHLLLGCCGVSHAEPAVAAHDVECEHECDHHDSQSEPTHDDEPCGRHCSTLCSPESSDRTQVAVPGPSDASFASLVAATPVVVSPAVVQFVERADIPAPPLPLHLLLCALRN